MRNDFRGQQISWLAARSIIHKFKRLYDPTLPEKPGNTPYVCHYFPVSPLADEIIVEYRSNSFPTPAQVAVTDLSVLRSAGLSTRKAEYSACNGASGVRYNRLCSNSYSPRLGQTIRGRSAINTQDFVCERRGAGRDANPGPGDRARKPRSHSYSISETDAMSFSHVAVDRSA